MGRSSRNNSGSSRSLHHPNSKAVKPKSEDNHRVYQCSWLQNLEGALAWFALLSSQLHLLATHQPQKFQKLSESFSKRASLRPSYTLVLLLWIVLKSKPSPSPQVLDTSVYALDLREESSSDPATTSKAELELVKNIFSVINQFPDSLHPFFNLRIDFFLLVRNSQNRRETTESIHYLLRIISNPSQE
nr:hypothetical protein Iba_chr04dCG17890 [Ipomoea batatas]